MSHTDTPAIKKAFLERMQRLLADEYPAFLESLSGERAFGLRANPLKAPPEALPELLPFPLARVPWAAEGFYYQADDRPGQHPYHDAGLYYIQEPSAMAAAAALDPRPGERVLDLCAAPGGKSTHIAGRMLGRGLLIANEIIPSRAKILAQNLERLGVSSAVVLNEDSERLAGRLPGFFDRILVDAPCSGEGMFRKDPLACNEWSVENVAACARRQQLILHNAAEMLRPGGRLVYSTCTFSPEENEGTVTAFLAAHPEFSLTDTGLSAFFEPRRADFLPAGTIPPDGLDKALRIWPHKVAGEGHFIAAFEKAAGWQTASPKTAQPSADKTALASFDAFCTDFAAARYPDDALTGNPLEGGIPIQFGAELYRLPAECFALDGLRVVQPGLHLGTLKKNRFEPAHALSHALPAAAFRQCLDLSADSPAAAAFLRGEVIEGAGLSGWVPVAVNGFVLGWGKAGGGLVKNHYPKGLRRAQAGAARFLR